MYIPCRQSLNDQTEHGGRQQHPQQFVSGDDSALQVRFDISGIQIGDGHQEAGSGERP